MQAQPRHSGGDVVQQRIVSLLVQWPLQLRSAISACTQGVDNYNYFVQAEEGNYIVTLLRTLSADTLNTVLQLMDRLRAANLPVAEILRTRTGAPYLLDDDRPVLVQHCLPGSASDCPTVQQCQQVGATLARLHEAAQGLSGVKGDDWLSLCEQLASHHAASLDEEERNILAEEICYLTARRPALPAGVLHHDFFCDNLLFVEEQCSGVLDFYCISRGEYIRDIALMLLDWAWSQPQKCFQAPLVAALIRGYEQHRKLSAEENRYLPDLLRSAAVSVWLERLSRAEGGARLSDERQPADMLRRIRMLRQQSPLPLTSSS